MLATCSNSISVAAAMAMTLRNPFAIEWGTEATKIFQIKKWTNAYQIYGWKNSKNNKDMKNFTSWVADSKWNSGDILNSRKESSSDVVISDVENSRRENGTRIVNVKNIKTVGKGRNLQHIQKSSSWLRDLKKLPFRYTVKLDLLYLIQNRKAQL